MPGRLTLALVAAAISISPLGAQIRGGGFGFSAGATGPAGIRSSGIRTAAGGSTAIRHGVLIGSARFRQDLGSGRPGYGRGSLLLPYPSFYSDSDAGYDSQEVLQPQVIVVPASAPAPPPEPPAPRESLLIEWRGDHFVRSTMSANTSSGGQIAPDFAEKSGPASPPEERYRPERSGTEQRHVVQPPRELPPAVLVFHDGRREEVSEYTIMSGTIYSKSDYWTTGSWSRKIQIADLDVPATLKLNQERGVKFLLPSSPNEVVIRP